MLEGILNLFRLISQVLGVQWAPLDIPVARRLQTLAAFGWACLVIFAEPFCVMLYIKLLYTRFWWLAILYGIWMLNDIEICNRGGRTIQWVRNWAWWQYYRDYFPIKLVKTTDLDPSKNYLFASYPHGLISSGGFGAFATNALDFHKKFPGMSCNTITLAGHFLVPFFRDLILALGACSSSEHSLTNLLNPKNYRGKCVVLIVGGAAEALNSHPGQYKIILSRRKGFVRIAIKTGASIVPVFSFGEPDVFRPMDNPEDSLLRRFQEKFRKTVGISPIFPIGRGMFQYSYGFVPMREPITTVVGAPMEVKKNPEPTSEEIDAVHAEFTKKLIELFESEKSKYLKNHEQVQLVIT